MNGSRSPTPHFTSSSSRGSSPRLFHLDEQRAMEDYISVLHHLGRHVFVVLISIIFGIFAGLSSSSLFSFIIRIFMLAAAIYTINFAYYKCGGRSITETFLTAFSVVSCTYFIVSCPFSYFLPTMALCAVVAIIYFKLG